MSKGKPNKRYTPEFKIMAVETMQKEKLSCCEAARQFDIRDHKRIAAWERIYLEEGLQIERRGRKSTVRPPKLKRSVSGSQEKTILRKHHTYCINFALEICVKFY